MYRTPLAPKYLNVMTFNVRSLVDTSRRVDLLNTLHYNKIDVGFIQECHLRENRSVHLKGYNFIYDNSRIGVAVVVKNTINYSRINIDDINFFGSFIQIELKTNNSCKKILFGSIYIPCNYPTAAIVNGLNKILDTSKNFDGFIIGGDLNAKNGVWGDLAENSNGRVIRSWLQDHIVEVNRLSDNTPSFPNGSSFLDHFLIDANLINAHTPNFKISSLPTFSDHFPLKIELQMNYFDFILNSTRSFSSFKNTNWDNFRRDIQISTLSIMPPENKNLQNTEIDQFIREFTTIVNSVTNMHCEKIEIKNNKIFISEKIKKFFRVKYRWQKQLKTIYHRTGNRLSDEYNILSKQIQLLKTIIKELINLEQAQIFSQRLGKIKPGPSAFKKIYEVMGNKKSPFCEKIVTVDGTITEDDEKCKLFRDFYSTVYAEKLPLLPVENLVQDVSDSVSNIPCSIYSFDNTFGSLNNEDTYHFVKVDTIKDIVNSINNKKSFGIDGIANYIIKKLPLTAFEFLTIIYNNCINNGYFPINWKEAKIIPLKKKKESESLDEFRPISLISNLGKILENVLKQKLEAEFIIDPLSCYQFGFRQSHSTAHALLKFHNDVTENLRNKKCTVAISLDIQRAFDTASHKGILYKLVGLGIDPYLLKLFQSYFFERRFCIQINNSLSNSGSVNCGVPQGSVLAPFLFNLFLYDFPHQSTDSKAILYADDCLIFSHDVSPAQALIKASTHLQTIHNFYKVWGIHINASKSEAICIRNASGKCPKFVVPESKRLHLNLDGTEIHFKDSLKYLGVTFDKLQKFNNHGRNLLTKAKRITGMFSRLLNSKYLPKNTKLLIYKVAIRSVLLYAFPIWFTISPTVAREMEVFERKILRKCINKNFSSYVKRYSNSTIYNDSAITPLCSYALSHQKRFVENLCSHDNVLLNEIFEYENGLDWSSSGYLSPIGILQTIIDVPSGYYSLPDFYTRSTPGSHRG